MTPLHSLGIGTLVETTFTDDAARATVIDRVTDIIASRRGHRILGNVYTIRFIGSGEITKTTRAGIRPVSDNPA